MAVSIACRDMGMQWCDFETRAENEQALLQQLLEHCKEAHDIDEEQITNPEASAMFRVAMTIEA